MKKIVLLIGMLMFCFVSCKTTGPNPKDPKVADAGTDKTVDAGTDKTVDAGTDSVKK